MINVPNKIYNTDINDVEIGVSKIHLYTKDEIEEAQIGYRIDNKGNEIDEWIGDDYIIIGNDSCCGDPIITDVSDDKLPVYSMFHDDWETLQKITNDFEQYISILKKINKSDLSDETQKNNLISDITKIVPSEGADYWSTIIQTAYEFLNDMD